MFNGGPFMIRQKDTLKAEEWLKRAFTTPATAELGVTATHQCNPGSGLPDFGVMDLTGFVSFKE